MFNLSLILNLILKSLVNTGPDNTEEEYELNHQYIMHMSTQVILWM